MKLALTSLTLWIAVVSVRAESDWIGVLEGPSGERICVRDFKCWDLRSPRGEYGIFINTLVTTGDRRWTGGTLTVAGKHFHFRFSLNLGNVAMASLSGAVMFVGGLLALCHFRGQQHAPNEANEITGANAGGAGRLPVRTRRAARIAQFSR